MGSNQLSVLDLTTYESIHCTGLLVVLESRTLFTRNIHQSWKFVTIGVKPSTLTQENLRKLDD